MMNCGWLIPVDSGNPEPDSIEDTYVLVECGAPVTIAGSGWFCDAGHAHRGIEIEWADLSHEDDESFDISHVI